MIGEARPGRSRSRWSDVGRPSQGFEEKGEIDSGVFEFIGDLFEYLKLLRVKESGQLLDREVGHVLRIRGEQNQSS